MDKFITVSALKQRGWNDSLIAGLLGEPDQLSINPHYRTGPKMRLYSLTRAVAAECAPAWIAYQDKRTKRIAAGARAAQTRKEQTLAWARSQEIELELIPVGKLIKLACESYNDHQADLGRFDYLPATASSDPRFLRRITQNYLRHRCSRYEEMLETAFGKTGIQEARDILRAKIGKAIKAAYPDL